MHRGLAILLLGVLAFAVLVKAQEGEANNSIIGTNPEQTECTECTQQERERLSRRECQIKEDEPAQLGCQPTGEWESFDGWYNNLARPSWGAVDGTLLRRLPPAYDDGAYHPSGRLRPNPRVISEGTMRGQTGFGSYSNRTVFTTFFGQQMVEEILDVQTPGCPPEYINIPIPKCDSLYDPGCTGRVVIPLTRSRYWMLSGQSPNNPRQQLNEITPYIDGGLFYGPVKAWSDALRSFTDGRMACSDANCLYPIQNTIGLPLSNPPPSRDHYLKDARRYFAIGNPRGNENPFVLAMHIMWFREHNWQATRIKAKYPGWNDEEIFFEARKWVIAEHQKISIYDWLPAFLGAGQQAPPYTGYKQQQHPGIADVFQAAAMRFGHTLIPPGVYRRDAQCTFYNTTGGVQGAPGFIAIRTCNTYWNSPDIVRDWGNIEYTLQGMASQITEREDNIITPDLRGFVFGPLEFVRRDLMAVNIQRGRDHGLPDYNTARVEYGLEPITDFDDIPNKINPNNEFEPAIWTNLRTIHQNRTDLIDIWTGGILETRPEGPGELFSAVLLDQYTRIRDGDRFWFENRVQGLFTPEEIDIINRTTLGQIFTRNAQPGIQFNVQDNIFFHRSGDPCPQPKQLAAEDLEDCTPPATFDYYNSSIPVLPSVGAISVVFTIGCLVLVFYIQRIETRRRLKIISRTQLTDSIHQYDPRVLPPNDIFSDDLKKGRLHGAVHYSQLVGTDPVYIRLEAAPAPELDNLDDQKRQLALNTHNASSTLSILNAQGNLVRAVPLHLIHSTVAFVAGQGGDVELGESDPGLVFRQCSLLLRIPKHYDIWLVFRDVASREQFLEELSRKVELSSPEHRVLPVKREVVTEGFLQGLAKTRQVRQAEIQRFFQLLKEELYPARKPRGGAGAPAAASGGERKASASIYDRKSSVFSFDRAKSFSGTQSQLERRASQAGLPAHWQSAEVRQILNVEITREEFADAFEVSPDNLFVQQIFSLADKDRSGLVSFRELLDMMLVFAKGNKTQKLRMLFDLYDIDGSGVIEQGELEAMLRSTAFNDRIKSSDRLGDVVVQMYKKADIALGQPVSFEAFEKMMSEQKQPDSRAVGTSIGSSILNLDLSVKPKVFSAEEHKSSDTVVVGKTLSLASKVRVNAAVNLFKKKLLSRLEQVKLKEPTQKTRWKVYRSWWRHNCAEIYCLSLYWACIFCVFSERFYSYAVEKEIGNLRRITGYGVATTRGMASSIMFSMSFVLLTVSRNMITFLRSTALGKIVPFDHYIPMHIHAGYTFGLFTLGHCVGHCFNFYHITTQPPVDLLCLFREIYYLSHDLPSFLFWFFGNVTGFSGVWLVVVIVIFFVFAMQRKRSYQAFITAHRSLYPLIYILTVLHGAAQLVQVPSFWFYISWPGLIFCIDKIISYQRKGIRVRVLCVDILPESVIRILYEKPPGFSYKSGQWLQVSCDAIAPGVYHPFSFSSSPNEEALSCHIRVAGFWTNKLRITYHPSNLQRNPNGITAPSALGERVNYISSPCTQYILPPLYIDGPFGEGHEDWESYKNVVMVGAGIGVTPFASILKDFMYRLDQEQGGLELNKSDIPEDLFDETPVELGRRARKSTRKLYMIWICRTLQGFEWLVDVVRQAEEIDHGGHLEVKVFITAPPSEFDLRTTMLYLLENQSHLEGGRDLFSSLREPITFGRPDMKDLLSKIASRHRNAPIGVLSCASQASGLAQQVDRSCATLNEFSGTKFHHYTESFG
jgi:dual oxidase